MNGYEYIAMLLTATVAVVTGGIYGLGIVVATAGALFCAGKAEQAVIQRQEAVELMKVKFARLEVLEAREARRAAHSSAALADTIAATPWDYRRPSGTNVSSRVLVCDNGNW
jgi:hypothetical protein